MVYPTTITEVTPAILSPAVIDQELPTNLAKSGTIDGINMLIRLTIVLGSCSDLANLMDNKRFRSRPTRPTTEDRSRGWQE